MISISATFVPFPQHFFYFSNILLISATFFWFQQHSFHFSNCEFQQHSQQGGCCLLIVSRYHILLIIRLPMKISILIFNYMPLPMMVSRWEINPNPIIIFVIINFIFPNPRKIKCPHSLSLEFRYTLGISEYLQTRINETIPTNESSPMAI